MDAFFAQAALIGFAVIVAVILIAEWVLHDDDFRL